MNHHHQYLVTNYTNITRRSLKLLELLEIAQRESLEDTVNSFANAKIVLGAHGSMFANTIFCGSGTSIFEFCPANRPDFSFRDKYKISEQYFHFLLEVSVCSDFNLVLVAGAVKEGVLCRLRIWSCCTTKRLMPKQKKTQ
jgi:hypothetical protein